MCYTCTVQTRPTFQRCIQTILQPLVIAEVYRKKEQPQDVSEYVNSQPFCPCFYSFNQFNLLDRFLRKYLAPMMGVDIEQLEKENKELKEKVKELEAKIAELQSVRFCLPHSYYHDTSVLFTDFFICSRDRMNHQINRLQKMLSGQMSNRIKQIKTQNRKK